MNRSEIEQVSLDLSLIAHRARFLEACNNEWTWRHEGALIHLQWSDLYGLALRRRPMRKTGKYGRVKTLATLNCASRLERDYRLVELFDIDPVVTAERLGATLPKADEGICDEMLHPFYTDLDPTNRLWTCFHNGRVVTINYTSFYNNTWMISTRSCGLETGWGVMGIDQGGALGQIADLAKDEARQLFTLMSFGKFDEAQMHEAL